MPFGGTRVEWFSLGGHRGEMNEYSIVTFVQCGWFTLLCAGDLPAKCWPELLETHGIRLGRLLQQTNFFVLPHHGRRDAYSHGLMAFMKSLQMGILSDGGEQTTSVTPEYDRHFEGWPACNMRTGECRQRKILTTRNDGPVTLRAVLSLDGACRVVYATFGGRNE